MIPKEPTDVEKQVLTAFQADGISVVDADGAEISGDFLRGLFLGKYDKNADYRGTCIANAVVSDALNMEFCETKFPVRFHNCSFVREIKLQKLVCPELDFRGCTLIGEFDARMVKVDGSMNMKKVSATATVSLANADIGGQLVCTGGSFQNKEGYAFYAPDIKVAVDVFLNDGFVAVGEMNLAGADIGRQLVCTGGNFWNNGGNAINAQSIRAGSMLLNSDSSNKQFKAEGTVWLAGADISRQLNCTGGNFHNKGKIAINAENIKASGGVVLNDGFNAEGAVWLVGAEIGGQFVCAGGSFQNEGGHAINAQSIKSTESVFLCTNAPHGEFKAVGEVSLAGAEIGGQFNCTGGSFKNEGRVALNVQNIKVTSDTILCDGFKAEGMVNLSGAEIGGQFNCTGGSFQSKNKENYAINAQHIKVADVFLREGFKAEGAVILSNADIRGQLVCWGGSFQNKGGISLNVRNIKVDSDVIFIPYKHNEKKEWGGFSANGLVFFDNSTIEGNLYLIDCKLAHLSLVGTSVSGEFHDDFGIYKDDNGNDIDLDIDGFRYQRLATTKEQEKERIAWVGSMSIGDKFYPQPYEQLMQVYRASGHTNWARDAGFALEDRRRKAMKSRWWKAWYWILRHTIGYGYKPFRVVTRWFLPAIVGGSMFLGVPCTTWENPLAMFAGVSNPEKECWSQVSMLPSDAEILLSGKWKNHKDIPAGYPRFIPFFYAVEVALPVLPLEQTEAWHPENPLVKFIQEIITIIGALVLTILASYGVGVLGPRWKDE